MPAAERQALRDAMFAAADGARLVLSRTPSCSTPCRISSACRSTQAASRAAATVLSAALDAVGLRRAAAGGHVLPLEPSGRSGDPERIWNALADRDVFVMPGSIMNARDYFRISLTASDEMVARALPVFANIS